MGVMVNSCSVVGCTTSKDHLDVIFFKFPTSRLLQRKWLDAINLSIKDILQASVCSRHFLTTDYEHVRGRTRLKAEVVPSIFTEINTAETKIDVSRTEDPKEAEEDANKDKGTSENDTVKEKEDTAKPKENEACLESKKEVEKLEEDVEELEKKTTKSDNCDLGKTNDKLNSDSDNIGGEGNEEDKIEESKIEIEIEVNETIDKDLESDNNCIASIPKLPNGPRDIDKHQDIEDLLTNYHIKQNNIHSLDTFEENSNVAECVDITEQDLPSFMNSTEPVFIEIAAQDTNHEGDGRDCLMLLESVQVEVDPTELMLEQDFEIASDDLDEPDDPETIKENAISLLTSSDEDDVIIQEPKIDTVEVSDETDEDNMPLVKLVKKKRKKKAKKKVTKTNKKTNSDNILMWGLYEYYCIECHFRTTDQEEYNKHRLQHTKVLLMCQLCGYMTSSEIQLSRHEKQHKDFKRYQCHLCDYKAKHNMSLVYHLKSHNINKNFKCNKCKYSTSVEREFLRHVMLCRVKKPSEKKLKCSKCIYRTNRPSDLRRHRKTHRDAEDDEYMP